MKFYRRSSVERVFAQDCTDRLDQLSTPPEDFAFLDEARIADRPSGGGKMSTKKAAKAKDLPVRTRP